MQPDLLTPEKEEKQPEPLLVKEETSSPPVLVPEAAQPQPISADEPTNPKLSSTAEKKRSKLNIAAIILGICVLFLLLGVAGLGYGVYTLRTELISSQQRLVSLQGEHSKLQSDYATLTTENEKLNADLTQTKTDLEKANADLASMQANLKKSEDKNKSLNAQVDKASKLTEILYAWTITDEASDVFGIDTMIKGTKDQQLIKQWDKFTKSPSDEAFATFLNYLVGAIRNSLK